MNSGKNTTRRFVSATLGALCVVSLAAGLSGCEPSKDQTKIVVGKVDTAELLHDDPAYQSLSIEYLKENTDLRSKFVEKMRAAGEDPTGRNSVQSSYQAAQKQLDGKWMNRTQEFLQSRHASIRDSAQKVAETKDIDIVIIDSKSYATTEWGGVDITKDLALSLSQGGDEQPAADATATASPEKKES